LERAGAAVLGAEKTVRFLRAVVDEPTHRFQPHIIGQDAATLAELAQIQRRYGIQLLVILTDQAIRCYNTTRSHHHGSSDTFSCILRYPLAPGLRAGL
jgi:hypothetical protein